jgi:hypothetical protein
LLEVGSSGPDLDAYWGLAAPMFKVGEDTVDPASRFRLPTRGFDSVNQNQPDADDPIAWRAIVEDAPVRSSDGKDVDTVYDVLGSNEEDIFHGIVVHLGRLGHRVLVLADDVSLITRSHVDVSLTSAELHALPVHAEEHTFHLGMTGTFRKHPGWTADKDR